MEPVITELMTHIEIDDQRAGDAYGESQEVNRREQAMPPQVAEEK
jgi:hypothetical protein